MFLPTRKETDEFTRPVESIMRCEDFKSNFARRLSTRYSTKSPVVGLKQDTSLKLPPADLVPEQRPTNNSPKVAHSLIATTIKVEKKSEIVKPPDKISTKSNEIRIAEVSALNMEVETLRWQLSQTEANRQMHLALLKQIVSFLNRVKEHMVCQTQEASCAKEKSSGRLQPRASELPRSRSVLHVSKNLEYSLTPIKKLSTRKMSKSISNVNGINDRGMVWNESKLSLNQETVTGQKITEEISRLITLANTVLSTKLPDLSCCNDVGSDADIAALKLKGLADKANNMDVQAIGTSSTSLTESKECPQNDDSANIYEEVADLLDPGLPNNFVSTSSLVSSGSGNDFQSIKTEEKETSPASIRSMNGATRASKIIVDKRVFDGVVTNFIEDESGFSSMSSFQEIGIPIINIIPPTPCKEVPYPIGDLMFDSEDKWKATLDIDKQTVQVFWV